jgi:hypothetical protein
LSRSGFGLPNGKLMAVLGPRNASGGNSTKPANRHTAHDKTSFGLLLN